MDKGLTVKQQAFVDAYLGSPKEAAKKAGLSPGYARKLLCTHPGIREAIRHRDDEVRADNIADRQSRQAFWTAVMRDESMDMPMRLRASELLGRSEGDFLDVRREDSGKGPTIILNMGGKPEDEEAAEASA